MTFPRLIKLAAAIAIAATLHTPASADNVADCEVLLMQVVATDAGNGEAQIASYRPAVDFLGSLYDKKDGYITEIDGHPIRAVMCRRNDVIPAASDYPIMATGVPFILSQDFDSTDTDSLTMFWKDGVFDYVYKGYPLSDEGQKILDDRLSDFSKRGLKKAVK